jgi:hypothetical protein
MAAIIAVGSEQILVAPGKYWEKGHVPFPGMQDNLRVLLTSRVVREAFDEDNGPGLIYPAFSKPVLQGDNAGFNILVCEIDRRNNSLDAHVQVIVDWAIVVP